MPSMSTDTSCFRATPAASASLSVTAMIRSFPVFRSRPRTLEDEEIRRGSSGIFELQDPLPDERSPFLRRESANRCVDMQDLVTIDHRGLLGDFFLERRLGSGLRLRLGGALAHFSPARHCNDSDQMKQERLKKGAPELVSHTD
jgi:hypothetical protein